ncbi:MAG TPA: glycosyltransferase family 4 protein [Miltoncostaeales bacterium]|mgnify:CR=1 FL=1|nr:glycosyltransferase family 4 protein [Miltoncostaeales bacterium]
MSNTVNVVVEFAGDLDVRTWRARHSRGEVPDQVPFGLHAMATDDVDVTFRVPSRIGALRTVARKVQGRAGGFDLVGEVVGRCQAARCRADVVLCMDERAGLPAAWAKMRTPVISGIAWIDEPRRNRSAAMVRHGLKRLDAMFSPIQEHLDSLADGWGLDPARLHVVKVGIDTDHFSVAPYPNDSSTVFSVGDDRFRDFPTLVRALGALRERGAQTTAEIATTLPVTMPDAYGTIHRQRVDSTVRSHIAAAGVVAVPNHHNRVGSGLTTILQAMAVGRPVVVSSSPGMDEYVLDGVTGYLVPPGDPGAMADALQSLLDDRDRAREMGEAGARHVREHFTSAQAAVQLRELARLVART